MHCAMSLRTSESLSEIQSKYMLSKAKISKGTIIHWHDHIVLQHTFVHCAVQQIWPKHQFASTGFGAPGQTGLWMSLIKSIRKLHLVSWRKLAKTNGDLTVPPTKVSVYRVNIDFDYCGTLIEHHWTRHRTRQSRSAWGRKQCLQACKTVQVGVSVNKSSCTLVLLACCICAQICSQPAVSNLISTPEDKTNSALNIGVSGVPPLLRMLDPAGPDFCHFWSFLPVF